VSINPRFRYADNLGACPCIEPLALGAVMDALCNGRVPSLAERVAKALAQLRKKLAR
jgi:hypothetical protein